MRVGLESHDHVAAPIMWIFHQFDPCSSPKWKMDFLAANVPLK